MPYFQVKLQWIQNSYQLPVPTNGIKFWSKLSNFLCVKKFGNFLYEHMANHIETYKLHINFEYRVNYKIRPYHQNDPNKRKSENVENVIFLRSFLIHI